MNYLSIVLLPLLLPFSRTLFPCKTETLCPSNNNKSPSPPPAPCNNHSTFCLYEFFTQDPSSKWNHTGFVFCDRLILLSIIILKVHPCIIVCTRISFLKKGCTRFCLCTYRILLIHAPVGEHLGCFYLLAHENDADSTGVLKPSLTGPLRVPLGFCQNPGWGTVSAYSLIMSC